MKQKKKLKIAIACHNAHNVLCKNNGQRVTPWENKSTEHQAIVVNSLEKVLSGEIESPEEAHVNFVDMKEKFGWEYGERFSTRDKTNPRICDYDELDDLDRQKAEMFYAVASSFKREEPEMA